MPDLLLGIAWYRREDYAAIRKIMRDGAELPEVYEQWRAAAEAGEQQLRRLGNRVERAYIDPATFPGWCRDQGLDVGPEGRKRFAAFIARKHGQR